ncbi:hypothetical protein Q9233_017630 [Columba guinea]|nr:hypothetical protein Q9233_017630 [Columba guinea]
MEQRPPSRPRVAWEEVNVPQAIRPRQHPDEVTRFRLLPHTSWLAVYEFRRDNLDFIVKFIESPANSVGEKLRFLGNVCELCNFSKNDTAPKGLGTFCRSWLLTAPCGCCFDPRVFRIQWTMPYNHQGTVVAAATPVLPTPTPSGYQSLEKNSHD